MTSLWLWSTVAFLRKMEVRSWVFFFQIQDTGWCSMAKWGQKEKPTPGTTGFGLVFFLLPNLFFGYPFLTHGVRCCQMKRLKREPSGLRTNIMVAAACLRQWENDHWKIMVQEALHHLDLVIFHKVEFDTKIQPGSIPKHFVPYFKSQPARNKSCFPETRLDLAHLPFPKRPSERSNHQQMFHVWNNWPKSTLTSSKA